MTLQQEAKRRSCTEVGNGCVPVLLAAAMEVVRVLRSLGKIDNT